MKKIVITIIFFLLALAFYSDMPAVVSNPVDSADNKTDYVYVVNHGWHTGLVIPSRYIKQHIPELANRFGYARYIEFGWGDRGFYQANEITTSLAIRAIFWPTETVVHAVAIEKKVDDFFLHSKINRLCLSSVEIKNMVQFIRGSFHKDKKNNFTILQAGLYGDSQFYQGKGEYFMTNTCNKWTARGLKSAGIDIFPGTKLTAQSVTDFLNTYKASTPRICK